MNIMKLIKTIRTASNEIFIYNFKGKTIVFKPSDDVEKELLVNKLAKLFDINVMKIKKAEIEGRKGILMDYLEHSILLVHYKKELNKEQIKQLKRIVLFDIWIGNKDRHTANIFVNDNLIAFDHDNVFNKSVARNFIKLDVGRRVNKDYVEIIEKILSRSFTVVQVLKKLGFVEEDFREIDEKDIRRTVIDKSLSEFLISRRDFNRIRF